MIATDPKHERQLHFYKGFIMARSAFDPQDFGINLSREEFMDQMVEQFGDFTRGALSLDEMLLRPRTALQFCDLVRQRFSYFDLPDDIILRSIMIRRKNP
jgi:hypothetical protein